MPATYNFLPLAQKLSELIGALTSQGGDGVQVLRNEAGQLAGRMGDAVGPRTLAQATKRIHGDIQQHLTIFPRHSNLTEEQRYSSTSNFTWLSSGPHHLTGINDEDNQTKASGAEALEFLRAGQRSKSRGNAYEVVGTRGGQTVQRLNRVHVSATAMRYVTRYIQDRTGELRASFYAVAIYLVPSKRNAVPSWVLARVEQVKLKGKSRTAEAGLADRTRPFLEFIVKAPGVVSNERVVAKIQGALEGSAKRLGDKLRKVMNGYAYNWKTGGVYRASTEVIEQ